MKFYKMTFGVLLLSATVFAQSIDYSKEIPFDTSVKKGTLKNGLTYYIKKNGKPANKVDLRLVVNAGSILENDDQQGLAHFMEHMNFNGTKHFPKNKLVDYLQSIGVKFGQHLNAYTGFDETVYFLPIPSDSPEKLENGFNIIEDWAFNADLSPEEIDKERGVVLEEYRIGLGANKRMMNRYLSKMMYKSHYADRLPIGKKEILENFKYDKLVSFYKDWYRPNLMSVIIVGDIDVDEMEKKVVAHFSKYENPKNEKIRTVFDVPNHSETFVAVESDKEETNAVIQLQYKDYGLPKTEVNVGDFKLALTESLFASQINARLDELVNSPTPPFLFGQSRNGETFARNKNAFQSIAMSKEDKQLDALKVLIIENERVRKFGFTQGELDRAKDKLLASMEKGYNNRDKTNSSNFVWDLQSNFLKNKSVPGIEWTFLNTKQILPTIDLKDVNALIKEYLKDDNRVVVLTGPEKEGLKKITEQEVLDVLKTNLEDIKPYQDEAVATSLIRNKINPGTIVKREKNDKIGTKTLFLSNGVKVTYKNTDFKNDEILFEAVSFGGSNLFTNEEDKKINFIKEALTEAGFSGLKRNDINKFLAGKKVSVRPSINDITERMSGNTSSKDFEYLFQMVYAYFTDLNLDEKAYQGFKQKQSAYVKNLLSNPNAYFRQELSTFLNKENPRYNGAFPNEKSLEESDYNLAYNKYKERFANAADFEFYFVGNIDDNAIEAFATKYLASLPSSNKKEKAIDLGFRMPKGDLKKVVNKGKDPKSTVVILYNGEAKYSEKEALEFKTLGEILTIKLIEGLRENESGVYGINAGGNMSKLPYGSYGFTISFPCGPENAEKLTASALNELKKIIDNGPEEKDIVKLKATVLLDYKNNIKENQFWLNNFSKSYINSINPEEILRFEEKINAITAKDIQNIAKKYLVKNKVIAMLMPEK